LSRYIGRGSQRTTEKIPVNRGAVPLIIEIYT